jgi:hypothetical protein
MTGSWFEEATTSLLSWRSDFVSQTKKSLNCRTQNLPPQQFACLTHFSLILVNSTPATIHCFLLSSVNPTTEKLQGCERVAVQSPCHTHVVINSNSGSDRQSLLLLSKHDEYTDQRQQLRTQASVIPRSWKNQSYSVDIWQEHMARNGGNNGGKSTRQRPRQQYQR